MSYTTTSRPRLALGTPIAPDDPRINQTPEPRGAEEPDSAGASIVASPVEWARENPALAAVGAAAALGGIVFLGYVFGRA